MKTHSKVLDFICRNYPKTSYWGPYALDIGGPNSQYVILNRKECNPIAEAVLRHREAKHEDTFK